MAGWSKVTDDSALDLDCFRTLLELHKNGVSVKCGEIDIRLRKLFNQLISKFLKQNCQTHSSYFEPLPPMLEDGRPVDLLNLYLFVRQNGGYESVCWDFVAKELGFDSSDSRKLKVLYVKYLEVLDERLRKFVEDKSPEKEGSSLMDLKLDSKGLFSDVNKKNDNEFVDKGFENNGFDFKDVKRNSGDRGTNGVEEDNESSRKRKRECYLPLLDWIKRVAKDPCDPAIGSLPERSKWKTYGSEHVWKKVLVAREAMLLKGNVDSKAEQLIFQKKQKMHPTMYVDHTEKSTSRCSQRLITAKETQTILSSKKPELQDCIDPSTVKSTETVSEAQDSFWGCNHKRKRVPLGRFYQAKLPEFVGKTYESESRWLGTRIWPLEKGETKSSLIERDRIGKGRQDSCGCQFPNSIECVRFHISEKRNRVKLELGSAFYKWKFNEMGEDVAQNWAKKEVKKFEHIIKSNPESSGTMFWDELTKYFKHKTKPILVSYYFNVYLFRRRAHQNRFDPSNVDSDDDELEKVGREVSNNSGSIFCSPKKVHLNIR